MTWNRLPALPVSRYAPVMEYLDGCLHLITGAIEDREPVSTDHFLQRVRDDAGRPSFDSAAWREGPPIPLGGDHAGSVVLGGAIYVIGGEHGHAPMTMDPSECCGTYCAHPYVFRYDPRGQTWTRLADMPFAVSHIESQIVVLDGKILVLGGTGDRDVFSDRVQEYDPATNRWRALRRLRYARKGGVAWHADGVVYLNGGQHTTNGRQRYVLADTAASRIRRGWWPPLV
jgi:N-acetylneuraminic acid mutarotase